MLRFFLIVVPVLFIAFSVSAQDHDFPFGQVTYKDLNMTVYERDTTAEAVVLDEFGEAYFDNSGENNLLLVHHFMIKILKPAGLDRADFAIPMYKDNGKSEWVREIQASSYTMENGSMKITKLEPRNIFTEKKSENLDYRKFAIPNVKVGSVIEVRYVHETPWIFNFRTWNFQSDIPKVKSEFWASMPGNYIYNVSLKGFLKLSKNESELVKDCFTPGGGYKADCSRMKLAIKNIPAFVDEEFMTAASNFISSVHFELSEVRYFDGRVDKVTKEWKDVEDELRKSNRFGLQLKRGKDLGNAIEVLVTGETDPLVKAKKVHNYIRNWYQWNGEYSKYCDNGIKKAFDSKKGNIGDINLSLIAALRYADLDASPVILSTRANGLPHDLYPVLSDFNYVVAKLNIGEQSYLLDATETYSPFGVLPHRCLNGRGRVLEDKKSYWYDLVPKEKDRTMVIMNLKLDDDGYFRGTMQNLHMGYDAVDARRSFLAHSSEDDYVKELDSKLARVSIKSAKFENADDVEKPFVEKFDVEIEGFDEVNPNVLLLNPYIVKFHTENPFKSNERLYPVDFGTPIEEVLSLTIELPEGFVPDNLPGTVGLALPNQGGQFILKTELVGLKLVLNHSLAISRTVYSSAEYHYLKELFDRIIQLQNTDIVFKKE